MPGPAEGGPVVAVDVRREAPCYEVEVPVPVDVRDRDGLVTPEDCRDHRGCECELGGAHLDEALWVGRAEALRAGGVADVAVHHHVLAARAADVDEIVRRIRFALAGESPRTLADVPQGSVIVARELSAADTSVLDPGAVLVRDGRIEAGE